MKRNTWIAAGLGLAGLYLFALKPSGRKRWAEEYRGILYAHRGLHDNTGEAPENSLAAFEQAVNHGFGIELDVQVTKDGKAVVFHDSLLVRAARDKNGNPVPGKIPDYAFEELQAFHLFDSDARIPSFKDVLDLVHGKVPLIVELKADTASEALRVSETADKLLSSYDGKYVVESFHPSAVLWYKKHRPEIIRGQLSDGFLKETGKLKYLPVEYLLTNIRTRPDFIAYNWRYEPNLSRRITARLFGCPSVTWTVQSEQCLEEMKEKFDLLIFDSFLPENNGK